MSFAGDLKAQLDAERDTVDVPFTLNKQPYVLRFTQMDPWEWAEAADRHPQRPGVQLDASFGYNMRALVKDVAPRCGVLLKDGEPVTLRRVQARGDEPAVDEWADLFKAMSPSAVQRMCSEVWGLHEAETIDTVVRLAKKLLSATGTSSGQQ